MTDTAGQVRRLAGVWCRRPLLLLACVALSACSVGQSDGPPEPLSQTAVPGPTPTTLATATPRPLPTSGPCVNDAEFLADESVPDGTVVQPGQTLDKSWLVRNSGTCDWGPGYTLVRVGGPEMGTPQTSGLFPARAGVEVSLRMALTAPAEPGDYTTTWQLRDANGEPFGDTLFVTIAVAE